ncbi:hypothetical protein SCHPADRAFT_846684 [Schizopora paradoxa]|uniref:Sensitive to high expression protein 9, mitochondrial n=1 Tax=Schizopora paradoxa TaxID=27342 RepID=A0A0H2S056_9AGAM|nr:hypothetical protein SCHPADRAFT_846684 [Schizopora paradoxa]
MIIRSSRTIVRGRLSGRAVQIRFLSARGDDPNGSPSDDQVNRASQAAKPSERIPTDLQARVQQNLRSWTARASHNFRGHVDEFSSKAAATFSQLGGKLNEVTGYEEIGKLKNDVVNNEAQMIAARKAAKEAKEAYEEMQTKRSASRQEVNDLLQRKSSWSETDVNRFTQLVRQDHLYEQEEARTKLTATRAADAVEIQFSELMRSILARYHEEQVWSDKIRSASTYGSLAVLGLNLAVFILAIIVVEPWKRRRLVESFERRVVEMNTANQNVVEEGISDLKGQLASQSELLRRMEETFASSKPNASPHSLPPVVVDDHDHDPESPPPPPSRFNWIPKFEETAKAAKDRSGIVLSAGAMGVVVGWLLSTLSSR